MSHRKMLEGLSLNSSSKAASSPSTKIYATKEEFEAAIGGIFFDKRMFQVAWTNYKRTIDNKGGHAFLYKLYELNDKKSDSVWFLNDFQARVEGRVYNPGEFHAWDVNQVWMLAQIHAQRRLIILSELDDRNVMRNSNVAEYSAFSREIAIAIKAGYEVGISEYNIILTPSRDNTLITLDDLTPTAAEIKAAADLITTKQNKIYNDGIYTEAASTERFKEDSVQNDSVQDSLERDQVLVPATSALRGLIFDLNMDEILAEDFNQVSTMSAMELEVSSDSIVMMPLENNTMKSESESHRDIATKSLKSDQVQNNSLPAKENEKEEEPSPTFRLK